MTASTLATLRFSLATCRREIRNRYMNSTIGVLWLLLNPVLQLAIYYFVFETIFQIKFDAIVGQSFVTFLAVALWPWVAFSEALISGTNAIDKHKDLLKKVYVPSVVFVAIEVVVPFVIHLLGLLFILLIVWLVLGQAVEFLWFPAVFFVYALQFIFCLGLCLWLAALQVFLKDIGQLLTPIVMVWFYLTPVIYPPNLVPDNLQGLLSANPVSHFIYAYRQLLLEGQMPTLSHWGLLFLIAFISLSLGYVVFKRLSPRFEDMF